MMITQTKETQAQITPAKALEMLKEGNERFVSQNGVERDYKEQVELTSGGQAPFAVVLGCIDSRVPSEIIFDQGIGDIFNARIAGHGLVRNMFSNTRKYKITKHCPSHTHATSPRPLARTPSPTLRM